MENRGPKDLDLNSGQQPFVNEDETHFSNSDSMASAKNPDSALGFNLNEDNSSKPSENKHEEHNTSEGAQNSCNPLVCLQKEGVEPPGPMVEAHDRKPNVGIGAPDLNEVSIEHAEETFNEKHDLGDQVLGLESRDVDNGSTKFGDADNSSAKLGDVVNGSPKFGGDVNVVETGKETVADGEQDLGLESTDVVLQKNGDSGFHATNPDGKFNSNERPEGDPMEEPSHQQGNANPVKKSSTVQDISSPISPTRVDKSMKIPSSLDAQMERHTEGSVSPRAKTNVDQIQMGKHRKGSRFARDTSIFDCEKLSVELLFEGPNRLSKEHRFSVGDIVWGKVKSHPWWPGQVFDPSDASEFARQRQKKDRLLVAYFGDQTFAWCEESQLKPFQDKFAELAKQSTAKTFCNAVDKALEELARQVQFGLSCSCLPDQTQSTLAKKVMSNAGVHEGAVVNNHRDISLAVTAFDPQKLLNYIRELAKSPFTDNNLEVTVISAQLVAFYVAQKHLVFRKTSSEDLLKNRSYLKSAPMDRSPSSTPKLIKSNDGSAGKGRQSSNKKQSLKNKKRLFEDSEGYDAFEHNELPPKSNTETPERVQKEKEGGRSVKRLSQSTSKKPRRSEFVFASGGYRKGSKRQQGNKDMHSVSPKRRDTDGDTEKIPKSFRIGECIRKIASQLTGSPPIIKSVDPQVEKTPQKGAKNAKINGKEHILRSSLSSDKSPFLVREDCSVKELLVELILVAQNPIYFLDENDIFSRVISVFLKFRDETFQKDSDFPSYRRSSKRSSKLTVSHDMDDSDDSNWTNKTIASRPKVNRVRRKRKVELQAEESEEKPKRRIRSPNSTLLKKAKKVKKVTELTDHIRLPETASSKEASLSPASHLTDTVQETLTALFMKFPPGFPLPSELELKELFAQYGQISETKFFSDSGCAQVIFKRFSDAEAAFHLATANKVFGEVTVSFRLRYLSSRSKKDMSQIEDPREDETSVKPEDRNTSIDVEDAKENEGQPHLSGVSVAENIGASNPMEELPILQNQQSLEMMTPAQRSVEHTSTSAATKTRT